MLRACCAFCLLALAAAASAQNATVIYRCTDAAGVVTLQNDIACPKGSRQEKRTVQTLPSLPPQQAEAPPTAGAQPPDGASFQVVQSPAVQMQDTTPGPGQPAPVTYPTPLPLPEAATPAPERLPPPALYQCNTVENDSYLSDTPDPKPRCVRVDTVGIDGTQQLGAGQACSMVYDQCQRVADNAACAAWRTRLNQAQSAWTYARADARAELKAEYDRIARVVAETSCNQ